MKDCESLHDFFIENVSLNNLDVVSVSLAL